MKSYLKLSKKIDLGCQLKSVDGITICTDVGAELAWNCRFPLGDREVTDTYVITGSDSTGRVRKDDNLIKDSWKISIFR